MRKRFWVIRSVASIAAVGVAYAQYPIMNMMASKVIQKYQNASFEQLWQERMQGQGKPKSQQEQEVIQMLHQDPQMRQAFFNQIAAPIVN